MKSNYRNIIEKALAEKRIKAYAAYDKARGTYVILTVGCYKDISELCTQLLKDIYDKDKSMNKKALRSTPYNFIPPVVLDVSCFGTRIELFDKTVWMRKSNQNQQLSTN